MRRPTAAAEAENEASGTGTLPTRRRRGDLRRETKATAASARSAASTTHGASIVATRIGIGLGTNETAIAGGEAPRSVVTATLMTAIGIGARKAETETATYTATNAQMPMLSATLGQSIDTTRLPHMDTQERAPTVIERYWACSASIETINSTALS